jgi:hypothetical protein
VTNEEATRWGLPCGGTLQLVMEPISDSTRIEDLLKRVTQQQLVRRKLDMDSGTATLEPGRWQDVLEFDGRVLSTVHGPRWRLVLIGAGQLTRYLAEMARMLDYHVVVIDPREEYAAGWDLASVPLDRGMPDDVVRELQLDGHSALVALTHDPKLDDLALMEGPEVGRVLRRRHRLEEEQRRAPRAAEGVRRLGRRDRAPARAGRPVHRLEDAARDRGGDPRRDDRGAPRREGALLGGEARAALRSVGLRSQADLNIVGLLLAAGSASRFGSDKLRHALPHGVSIAVQSARHPRSWKFARVVAVVRPDSSELVAKS